ncbi:ABC transporter ATP-binding protein [bacterium]|nr:MAG: ABC transporter ATP-binding protein [bacterium]
MGKILEIKGVTKTFGKTVAVDNLSLTLDEGEIFGFLGPNGAGKTTTIKMIAGLLRPDKGTILINGYDIVKQPTEAKKFIGYIPDNPYIYDKLTGREFLELVGSLYRMDKKTISERIERLFEIFGIDEWGDSLASEYSHGMRQKIIMSSAIIHDPKLLIIDEPMVGLDPQSQRLVKRIMHMLAERGTTIFMSTHTLSVAEDVCTRLGIIHKGKLLAMGTLDELRQKADIAGKTLEDMFVALTGEENKISLWE